LTYIIYIENHLEVQSILQFNGCCDILQILILF
jgi:hypothetical protein